MYKVQKLPNAAASVIEIPITTAANILDLIDAAAGTVTSWGDLNALDIYVADDVRFLADKNSPKPTEGFTILAGTFATLRGMKLADLKIVALGGAPVVANVMVGYAENGEPSVYSLPGGTGGGGSGGAVSIADGDDVSLGAKADVAASTDTGTFSLIALTKRVNSHLTTVETSLTSLLGYTDGIEALLTTIDGRVDGLEALEATIASAIKAVDSVAGATDPGNVMLVRRQDALGALTPADGDYTTLRVSNQGSLWVQVSGPISLNATISDDASFTPGVSSVLAAGYFADETGTDSVNEGDIGAARMTLDRKQINASEYLDDGGFTPAAAGSYVTLIAAQADETTPDSVDEGDIGAVRMTLTRFLKISNGDLGAGENQSEDVLGTARKILASSTYSFSKDVSAALEASSISKATAGNLFRSFGVISATAPTGLYYILHLDSATLTADGAVTHLITPIPVNHVAGADSSFDTGAFDSGVAATNGIVIVLSSTMVTKTISSSYLFATVLFK